MNDSIVLLCDIVIIVIEILKVLDYPLHGSVIVFKLF